MPIFSYINDSVKGIERKVNKDKTYIKEFDGGLLAVVFDGISSAKDALDGIAIISDFLDKNHTLLSEGNFNLSDLMFDGNKEIRKSNLLSPFSTYTGIYIPKNGKAQFSSLGDSRIYEVTPQYLKQITTDDNVLYNKNIVTKYLGMIDLERESIQDFSGETTGRSFLLCSDGFYSILEENLARFFEILNFKNITNVHKSLKTEVEGKNPDDSSYIFVNYV